MAIGLLLARLLLGSALAAHGAQKLFGWFGGGGPAGTAKFFESLGFRPGSIFAIAAGLGEFVGGLLTLLGFLGAAGPVVIVLVMLVAIFSVHVSKGFWASKGGWELPSMNVSAALAIAFAGNGAYSIDHWLGWSYVTSPGQVWTAIACAFVLAFANLLLRRPARPSQVGTG
jgi:putative oxidoreductase